MVIVVTGVRVILKDIGYATISNAPICTFRRLFTVPKNEFKEDTIENIVTSLEINEPVEVTNVQTFRNKVSYNLFYVDKSPKSYKSIKAYRERFFYE